MGKGALGHGGGWEEERMVMARKMRPISIRTRLQFAW